MSRNVSWTGVCAEDQMEEIGRSDRNACEVAQQQPDET